MFRTIGDPSEYKIRKIDGCVINAELPLVVLDLELVSVFGTKKPMWNTPSYS